MASVLFIGGTGLISAECVAQAVANGWNVFLLNRGKRPALPGTTSIVADIQDPAQVHAALRGHRFDVVANFIAFTPEDVQRDLEMFAARTHQYIFVSSCACYQKPPRKYLMDESTPLENPFWPYAQLKIAAENIAMRAHREGRVPVTIVRPSLTYGISRIPAAYHNSTHSWGTAQRLLDGKPIIIHGDGTSLWQVTHAADFARGFVGLLGNPATLGQSYNITTDEVLTWNDIFLELARALGVKARILHVPTDVLAKFDTLRAPGLLGDKAHSVVIVNDKIKKAVPGFRAQIPFSEGIAKTVAWFREDPARRTIDPAHEAMTDRIIAAFSRVMGD